MVKKKSFQISNALSEGLEETIASTQRYSEEIRVDVIPLKKIEVDPDNPRDLKITFNDVRYGLNKSDPDFHDKSSELLALQSLAHSIKDQGIINPIVVYKQGEFYRLIAGERRTLASILAGKETILARILDNRPSSLKISLLQWIENIERKDLSLGERLKNLEKIVSAYAMQKKILISQLSTTELCQLIGCVKSHAINYKTILNADDKIKNIIYDNKIKNLEKAAFIANITIADLQQKMLEACIKGAPLKKLKFLVKQYHAISDQPKAISRRGRQSLSVQLGATKNIKVAKIIIHSIIKNSSLPYATDLNIIDWTDYKVVTQTFRHLLKKLEETHT